MGARASPASRMTWHAASAADAAAVGGYTFQQASMQPSSARRTGVGSAARHAKYGSVKKYLQRERQCVDA